MIVVIYAVSNTDFFMLALHTAALSIVKEVANHANDIMKQGVRPDCAESTMVQLLVDPFPHLS